MAEFRFLNRGSRAGKVALQERHIQKAECARPEARQCFPVILLADSLTIKQVIQLILLLLC